MGVGMGLSMTPSTEAITASLPRAKQGVASALNDVTREFGTALTHQATPLQYVTQGHQDG